MNTARDVTIRLYEQTAAGDWHDWEEDYDLEAFAGFLPNVGDVILKPGVPQGLDRHDPQNRRLLTVVKRIFNPRDLQNYVVLVVEEHVPEGREIETVSLR